MSKQKTNRFDGTANNVLTCNFIRTGDQSWTGALYALHNRARPV